MKTKVTIISIFLMFLLINGRCSREKPTPPPKKKITTVKITKNSKAEKLAPSEKIKDKKTALNAKGMGDINKVASEKKVQIATETYSEKKETTTQEVPGYYTTKKGESLSDIASKEDVYKNSLKWPILYRLNLEELRALQLGQISPDKELPKGLLLKTISSYEVAKNSKSRSQNVWTINVLSATTTETIPSVAIKLIENGYLAYITRFKLKGKEWMRLRVGFFDNRPRAETESKKIMSMLDLDDAWVARAGEKEIEEFGGYL